jgi:ubiquinol-cytochrome c reductase cytochrome b subunit
LNRFFSLHYLLPFAIAGAVIVHMAAVHQDGSNNPLGIASTSDKISFFPYFFIKDTLSYIAFILIFFQLNQVLVKLQEKKQNNIHLRLVLFQ